MTFWPVSIATMTSFLCKFMLSHKIFLDHCSKLFENPGLLKKIQMSLLNVRETIRGIVNHLDLLRLPWQPKLRKLLFTTNLTRYAIFSLVFLESFLHNMLTFLSFILQNNLFSTVCDILKQNETYFNNVIKKYKNRKKMTFWGKIIETRILLFYIQ